jgi:hypothetical protein
MSSLRPSARTPIVTSRQVWKGAAEFSGRTVMRAGVWLDDPLD